MPTQTARLPRAVKPASPAKLKRYFEAKLSAELGPHNVKRLLDAGAKDIVILDVRTRDGYRAGHIPGVVNIPFEELPARLRDLTKQNDIITYCWDTACILCTKAAYVLASKGFRAKELLGGIKEWQDAGFPIEKDAH